MHWNSESAIALRANGSFPSQIGLNVQFCLTMVAMKSDAHQFFSCNTLANYLTDYSDRRHEDFGYSKLRESFHFMPTDDFLNRPGNSDDTKHTTGTTASI